MNNNTTDDSSTGPQGTQVFELDDVSKMLAAEIFQSQPENADTPVFIGISQNMAGQQFELSKHKLEVGRRPNSDIVLDHASVSSMHAQIIFDGEDWKILNLLSSNGTFVNGEKISEKVIYPGDRVAFAGAEFVYTLVKGSATGKPPSGKSSFLVVAAMLVIALAGLFYFIL